MRSNTNQLIVWARSLQKSVLCSHKIKKIRVGYASLSLTPAKASVFLKQSVNFLSSSALQFELLCYRENLIELFCTIFTINMAGKWLTLLAG